MTHVRDHPGKKGVDMETMQETSPRHETALTGVVKWFNPGKGYGFIAPDTGGDDIFVHISAVERAGLRSLNDGQKVSYEVVHSKGKSSAEDLRVL